MPAAELWKFCVKPREWTLIATPPSIRHRFNSAAFLYGEGFLGLYGGYDGKDILSDSQLYWIGDDLPIQAYDTNLLIYN